MPKKSTQFLLRVSPEDLATWREATELERAALGIDKLSLADWVRRRCREAATAALAAVPAKKPKR